MILTKGAHQIAKFRTFNCSDVVSLNLHFDRLLLLKVYKISAKKVCDAKCEEKPICCFKNDKILMNFDSSTQKSWKIALWLIPFVQSM